MKRILLSALATLLLLPAVAGLPRTEPRKVGLDAERLARADEAIRSAVERHEFPGAVLAVVRHGKLAHLEAFGYRQVYPDTLPMLTGTVFDMASCSKSMSTAICAMILIERGQLRLQDRVDQFIPGFRGWTDEKGGSTPIRVVDLMTHTSGLPPYANAAMLAERYGSPCPDSLIAYIASWRRDFAPRTRFQYSCLNFITLQRVIETISGQSLQEFARQNLFDVLGMNHTDYNPAPELAALCAPTEKQPDGSVLQGRVHDPLARLNGGVSGNAGVFSPAEDIAVLCAALLNGGAWDGHRILSAEGVRTMRTVPRGLERFGRALGWDVYSPYASNNGDLFGPRTFGHTGYTGTAITIDPDTDTAVILLTNRAHPDDKGEVLRLRALVANAVAASIVE